jgi:DNA damage-binding protein 1
VTDSVFAGSLVQQYGENAGIASPRLIFSTSAGSLGVIVELDAASSKILSDLERNMRRCIPGVGGIKQEECVPPSSHTYKAY